MPGVGSPYSCVDRDRLGIEDPTFLKTGLGTAQDTGASAIQPESEGRGLDEPDKRIAALMMQFDHVTGPHRSNLQ